MWLPWLFMIWVFLKLPPCSFDWLSCFLASFSECLAMPWVHYVLWSHVSPDVSTWALDICSFTSSYFFLLWARCLSLLPLLGLPAYASHCIEVVVRHFCFFSSWRLLGLGCHNRPTYITWHLPYLFGNFLPHSTGFFLVHSNYTLLWRTELMKKGQQRSPVLHVYVGACWGLKLILGVILDFFPNLFIEAESFAEHGDCHHFWLASIAGLSQVCCPCFLSTGITRSHHICLLSFYVGSWVWVMVFILAWWEWELYPQNHFPGPPFKRKFRQNANANKYFPTKGYSKWSNASKF